MRELRGHRVVVVGPATAPARAERVPRVDELLAALAERYDVAYVRTAGPRAALPDDRLHLTPAGHQAVRLTSSPQQIAGLSLGLSRDRAAVAA